MEMYHTPSYAPWVVSHKPITVEAGLGHMGIHRNLIHPKFGNFVSLEVSVETAMRQPGHLDDVDGSCPLIGLPSDAARGGEAVKTAYRQVTESMIRLFEANLSGPEAREQALVFVALCVGGIVLARGIDDRALGDELRKSAERHILAMTGWEDGQLH